MRSFSTIRIRGLAVLVTLGVTLVLGAACGSDGNKSAGNGKVACSDIPSKLATLDTQLKTDQKRVDDTKGQDSADAANAKKAVENDTAQIIALQNQQRDSCASPGPSASSSASQPATTIDADLLKSLTVGATGVPPCNTYAPPAKVKSGLVMADLGFQATVISGARYSGDALSTPLAGSTPILQAADAAYKTCADPNIGYANGNALYNQPLGATGKTIGSLNPWLAAAHANESTSTALVTTALPSQGIANPTDAQKQAAITAWTSYEDYAAKVVALLSVFNTIGVLPNPQSIANWHFDNGGAVVGNFPVVVLNNQQENLPALVLVLKNKGQTCELARIGLNVKDTRPERFNTEGCASPSPSPSCGNNCGTSTPGCSNNCGTPGCQSNCGGTPSCSPTPNVESCGKHSGSGPDPINNEPVVPSCPPGQAVPRGGTQCAPKPTTSPTPTPTRTVAPVPSGTPPTAPPSAPASNPGGPPPAGH